jgi:hypothetical protein
MLIYHLSFVNTKLTILPGMMYSTNQNDPERVNYTVIYSDHYSSGMQDASDNVWGKGIVKKQEYFVFNLGSQDIIFITHNYAIFRNI